MKRKPTISLADDRRARVPFALVAVVLLTTSVVTVSMINQRSTPEVDISPDLVHERTTLAAESVISEAASDAIAEAGEEPVTSVSNTPVGTALASGGASSDEIFKRYVKLRIYMKVNKRLRDSTQTISRPGGEVRGEVFLPPLENDHESISESLNRVDLEIGEKNYGEDDSESDLGQGEYRVTVEEVQHTVSVGDDEIHREQQSYSTTDETAVFEMHSQVNDYQRMLNNDIEKLLYATVYPMSYAQAVTESFLGEPIEAFAWQQIITNQELIVFTNLLNYDMQQAAFGTRDQSYPTMANAGGTCLIYYYLGNLIAPLTLLGGTQAAARRPGARALVDDLFESGSTKVMKNLLRGAPVPDAPHNSLCYYTMYAEIDQATTTATTDIPRVSQFADEDIEWESKDDLYEEAGDSGALDNYELSSSLFENELSKYDGGEAEAAINEMGKGPNSKKELRIGPFANYTYNDMFGLDSNGDGLDKTFETGETNDIEDLKEEFDSDVEIDDMEIDAVDEFERRSGTDTGIDDSEDDSGDDTSVDATEAEREDVNRLRKQLIEDIDPIELSGIQAATSDNVYGTLIYQIESNSDNYIFGDGYQTNAYGLRNGYLQRVISSLEDAEEQRKESAERFNETVGNESIKDLLVLGQAAIEGEADNPDRIEEIADDATYDSDRPGSDRFDLNNVERNLLVWWEKESDEYRSSRWDSASKEPDGIPSEVELGDSGIPGEVTKNMLYKFGDGELPKSTDVTTSVRISITDLPAEEGDDGFVPLEIDEENRTDEAYLWNIRAVDLDKDIYRVTNGQLINRTFGGSQSVYREIDDVYRPVDTRTYLQLHRVNASMDLTDEAKEEVGLSSPCDNFPGYICDPSNYENTVTKDRYILTAVDVPQEEDTEEGIDVDEEELAIPELRPADNEDFQFDIHASPGYLSGMPIVREMEPSVRPPGKGPLHGRNSAFAPFSSKVTSPLPNFGIPLVPLFPPKFNLWLFAANGWGTELKAEYARFELRSNTSNGLDTGPETYVRQDMNVDLEIDGHSVPVGSVEPISISATNAFPMIGPGFGPTFKAPPKYSSSWGIGNNLNLISANIFLPRGTEWTPEQCTAAWPEVGPGVYPKSLGRNCADFGPVGEALTSKPVGAFVGGSAIVHATIADEPRTEEAKQKAEELCELDEPCPDIGPRDRNSNA